MDRLSYIILLLDFYRNLLTEKQRDIMSRHFEEDMSLAEIAEEYGISRQAVHDIIKRSEKALLDYEEELGLVDRFLKQKQELIKIKTLLSKYQEYDDIKQSLDILNKLLDI
ncbi:YlxM family DNA-binding protein [Caloramator sp. mosi_1]|uniref:YlxM family DNA-binding protein n=1 Tax=Caloramator sp. mosi_1 TaxID=3023090 RepID=UPI00235FE37C|nr:YlxM family DNA-binding protein [Caloramator sp. mosi_1]WDC84025.1 YlxM family DNA-binding protein [Caloramator sp. mosi_1]